MNMNEFMYLSFGKLRRHGEAVLEENDFMAILRYLTKLNGPSGR